jgi:hypothetical protein
MSSPDGPPPPYDPTPYGYPQPLPYGYATSHSTATTSMVLGIIGLVSAPLAFLCCVTLPGIVCAPIALGMGLSARRTIDKAPPATYSNRGQAQAGFVLGLIGCIVGVLAIGAVALLFGFAASGAFE